MMLRSSLWKAAWDEGRAEGRAEAAAEAVPAYRGICLEFMKRHHAALLPAAKERVDACTDLSTLRKWILSAGQMDNEAFARLIGMA